MKKENLKKMINEIKNNLNNKNYYSALVCTMLLPDICAKMLYPSIPKSQDRYEEWIKQNLDLTFEENDYVNEINFLSPENLYNFRNFLVHDGIYGFRFDDKFKNKNHIENSNIRVALADYGRTCIMTSESCFIGGEVNKGIIDITLFINVIDLCQQIISKVEKFIEEYNFTNADNDHIDFIEFKNN